MLTVAQVEKMIIDLADDLEAKSKNPDLPNEVRLEAYYKSSILNYTIYRIKEKADIYGRE